LTTKWSDAPAPTASLLSIASRKGLVAAAGPEAVYLATTEAVRKALEGPKEGGSETRTFQSQVKLPLPMRVSQVAFTADEQYLLLSAEKGGGLAVYDVQTLSGGTTTTSFEVSTNGESLRDLVPNPAPETAELCAMVTTNGNLLIGNLKDRKVASIRAQASCVAWSSKGKQLVAGLADGTVCQLTPAGEEKALVPKPPNLGDVHGMLQRLR
jgi:nucleoporin NUP159